MEALQETTVWDYANHTYLLDGSKLVAYLRQGESEPTYFKNGISGFDRRGRTFVKADISLFPRAGKSQDLVEVPGSNGKKYQVNLATGRCSCPGFNFRGDCKHIKLAVDLKSNT